jgi:hypothetical protein
MSCKVEHGIQKIKCQNALTPQKESFQHLNIETNSKVW